MMNTNFDTSLTVKVHQTYFHLKCRTRKIVNLTITVDQIYVLLMYQTILT